MLLSMGLLSVKLDCQLTHNNNNGVSMSAFSRGRFCSLFTLLIALCLSSNSWADRLDTAAQAGPRAVQALLLDIVDTGERLVAVGEQGIILLSDNQGKLWRTASVPVRVMLTAVQFTDVNRGWAVGHDGAVLKTEDGGQHWQRVLTGKQINQLRVVQLTQALADLPAHSDEDQREELEYALDDARQAEEDGPSTPLLDVWFKDRDTGFVLGAYGLLLKTTDGGVSWRSLSHHTENIDNFHLNSFLATAEGRLLIAGEAGVLLSSDDQGESWQALPSPYEGSFFAMAQSDQLYLMGLRGNLFRSRTGDHWLPMPLSQHRSLTGAIVDGEQLWLLGQGGLVLERTPDGFSSLKSPARRSFSAGVKVDAHLVLVGEGGVTRMTLAEVKP